MPRKDIYLFDDSNNPLQVPKIRVELFDAATGTLLDFDYSKDLNPGSGTPSNKRGVRLTFTGSNNPLDIYIKDGNYSYPGNTVRNLNGQTQDSIDIDLLRVARGPGGQINPPTSATPTSLSNWVKQGRRWSTEEKKAVRNLIFNYVSVFVPRLDDLPNLTDLRAVANNWEEAMVRLGIPVALLKE